MPRSLDCCTAPALYPAVSLAGEPGYKGVVPSTEKDQPAPSTAPLSGPSSGTDAKNPFQVHVPPALPPPVPTALPAHVPATAGTVRGMCTACHMRVTSCGMCTLPHSSTPALPPLPACLQKRAAKQAAGDLEQADSANAARKGTSNAGNPFSQGSEVPESTRGQLLAEPLNVWQKIGRAFGKQS